MRRHKTLSSKVIFESRNYRVETEDVELFSGTRTTRDIVVHPGAAIMVPQERDGTLILVRQYRQAIKEEILEFPAGTLENNEPPIECAKRELMEEVGKAATDWIDLGVLFPAPGFCSERQFVFLARDMTPASAHKDEDELIELAPMKPSEVVAAIKSGQIKDGKTIASFYKAVTMGYIK